MAFNEWFHDLVALADEADMLHLIGDAESHRDGYEDGLSPAQELESQITEASSSI